MKSRKWLWVAVGIVCLLGVTVALAWPTDELAGIRSFHPQVEAIDWSPKPGGIRGIRMGGGERELRPGAKLMVFSFKAPTATVLAALPGSNPVPDRVHKFLRFFYIRLPSGRLADVEDWTGQPMPDGTICELKVFEDAASWYQYGWARLMHHLGL